MWKAIRVSLDPHLATSLSRNISALSPRVAHHAVDLLMLVGGGREELMKDAIRSPNLGTAMWAAAGLVLVASLWWLARSR